MLVYRSTFISKIWPYLRALIIFAGIAFLLSELHNQNGENYFKQLGASLIISWGTILISILIASIRFKYLLTFIESPLALKTVYLINIKSLFYYFFVPMAAGVDISRIAKIRKENQSITRVKAALVVVLDRVIGVFSLAIIFIISTIVIYPKLTVELISNYYILIFIPIIVVTWFLYKRFGHNIPADALKLCRFKIIACSISISIFSNLIQIVALFIVSKTLDYSLTAVDISFALSGALFLQLIPINILGVGAVEIGGVALYLLLGQTKEVAISMVTSLFILRLLTGIVGAILEVFMRDNTQTDSQFG